MRATIDRWRGAEDGASATVFVLSLFTLLGVAMLALDGGSLYLSQRGQVADTDSAALASAQLLIDDSCSTQPEVDAEATTYILANDPDTRLDGPVEVDRDEVTPCWPAGTVSVLTDRDPMTYFSGVFGFSGLETAVRSAAAFGQVEALAGVRPLGLCGLDPHYADEWQPYFRDTYDAAVTDAVRDARYDANVLATDLSYALNPAIDLDFEPHPTGDYPGAADHVHRIVFERLAGPDGSDCPGASGNFGWIDFDGGGGGTRELTDRIRDGYDGDLALGSDADGDEDCDAEDAPPDDCPGEPGARGTATGPALDSLVCGASLPPDDPSCRTIYIVVYSDVTGPPSVFNLQSLVGIVIRGYDVGTGRLGGDNYIDVEFVDEQVSGGVVGGYDPDSTAPFTTVLCGASAFDNC